MKSLLPLACLLAACSLSTTSGRPRVDLGGGGGDGGVDTDGFTTSFDLSGGSVDLAPCQPGSYACEGTAVVLCDSTGRYVFDHSCPELTACTNGRCDDVRCDDEHNQNNPYALPANAWGRFRHDNRNSGWTPAVVAPNPTLKWKIPVGGSTVLNTGGALCSGPVVDQNNRIYIGAGDGDGKGGDYYAFDATGKQVFDFAASRGYGISTPAVRIDGYSYFSTTNSVLFAITPTGTEDWHYQVGEQADSDPLITKDGTLIYGSDDGTLYALSPMGTVLWMTDPTNGPGEVDGGLAESCDGTIYAGGKNGWFALDAKTGATKWHVPVTADGTGRAALLSSPQINAVDGTLYGFDYSGYGWAIDASGNVLWSKNFAQGGAGASLARVGGVLFTLLNDGFLHAIDAKTGAENWKQDIHNGSSVYLLQGPVVDGNLNLYIQSSDGYLYSFDTQGNQRWRIPHSGANAATTWYGTIAIGQDGTLYVPGNDGYLYAYQ